ncbi:hypothetical protein Tco_0558834 [Tanacetum coccineum]
MVNLSKPWILATWFVESNGKSSFHSYTFGVLNKGSDLSADLDRNLFNPANFPFNDWTSFIVHGEGSWMTAFVFSGNGIDWHQAVRLGVVDGDNSAVARGEFCIVAVDGTRVIARSLVFLIMPLYGDGDLITLKFIQAVLGVLLIANHNGRSTFEASVVQYVCRVSPINVHAVDVVDRLDLSRCSVPHALLSVSSAIGGGFWEFEHFSLRVSPLGSLHAPFLFPLRKSLCAALMRRSFDDAIGRDISSSFIPRYFVLGFQCPVSAVLIVRILLMGRDLAYSSAGALRPTVHRSSENWRTFTRGAPLSKPAVDIATAQPITDADAPVIVILSAPFSFWVAAMESSSSSGSEVIYPNHSAAVQSGPLQCGVVSPNSGPLFRHYDGWEVGRSVVFVHGSPFEDGWLKAATLGLLIDLSRGVVRSASSLCGVRLGKVSCFVILDFGSVLSVLVRRMAAKSVDTKVGSILSELE